jgi:hypothetical protein
MRTKICPKFEAENVSVKISAKMEFCKIDPSLLGGETPSRIRAWSLIRNEKPIVFFERHCRATEKSGHCMCKELPVILFNKVVDPKRIIGKN